MDAKTVTLTVNGRSHRAKEGEGLLGALRRFGYRVPALCHHDAVSAYGACRLCLVEVRRGRKRTLTTSCNYPVQEGLEVFLDTDVVVRHRRTVFQLLLAMAPMAAPVRQLAAEYGVTSTPYEETPGGDCILCGICTRVCAELVGAEAIAFTGRGTSRTVGTPYNEQSEVCLACGACVYACPTGRLRLLEDGARRQVPEWHRESPLAHCSGCGRPIGPEAALDRIAERTGLARAELERCVDCRATAAQA